MGLVPLILQPLARLDDALQVLLLRANEPLDMPAHEPTEPCAPLENVAHERAVAITVELVDVPQRSERAANHLVDEEMRPLYASDPCREALTDSEVTTLERHEIAGFEPAGHFSRLDQPFSGECGALGVNKYVASKIETDIRRRVDAGVDGNARHATAARSVSVEMPGLLRFPRRVSESEDGSTIVVATAWMSSSVTASICRMISSGLNWRPK